MILTPAQKQIAKDTHRFRVVCAGRRFGKSTLAVWEMFGKAVSKDDRRVVYIAPTYQQARDICWQELKKVCKPVATAINESRLEIIVKTQDGGSSTIWLRGWESIETLRGQKFDFIVIDEIAMMRNWEENWMEVIRPTLTDRKGEVLFISTPKGFNHFYDLYGTDDEDYKAFHFTSYDNPYLPVDEIDKAKNELPEDKFAQEYMADFRKQEGLVYKEFNRALHLFDDHTPRKGLVETIAGVDFGFTNPSVIVRIEHDTDNHYWVTSEWYKTGKTNAELIEYARHLKINTFYPDPAEPDRIEEMKRAGLNVREVSKDIEKGIDSVRELLKQGRLHIHKNCTNLIWEMETYAYPESTPDRNESETPLKENDHAMDALRYALHMNQPAEHDGDWEFGLYNTQFR